MTSGLILPLKVLVDNVTSLKLVKLLEAVGVFWSVACDDPFSAILLLLAFAIGGIVLSVQWVLAHGFALWILGCFVFVLASWAFRVLVDSMYRAIADRVTEKRKSEWNSRQH